MKNVFSPIKSNAFLRFLLRPTPITLILLGIISLRFITAASWSNNIQASDLSLENIIAGVNNERSLRNIPLLKTDTRLSVAAQSKSDDMQLRHYFSHTDPEGNYIWDKIVAAGYSPYITLGENLAIEFYNTESLIAAWMNSPTHRANLLSENFKDQGMGINFGSPAENQYYSAITNTFGTLLLTTKQPTPQTIQTSNTPKPSSPINNTPKPTPTPSPTAAPTPSPAKIDVTEPVIKTENKNLNATVTVSENDKSTSVPEKTSAPPIDNSVIGKKENNYKKTLIVNIALGSLLVMFLFIDIKSFWKEKYIGLDKKLNNLSLLILAILLTALLYWL